MAFSGTDRAMPDASKSVRSLDSAYHQPIPSYAREFARPSAPHITVPPPLPNSEEHNIRRLIEKAAANFESAGRHNADFLDKVTFGLFKPRQGDFDWKYEDRRKFQSILPFLFLGPFSAARDANALRDNLITMLIIVRDMRSAMARLMEPKVAKDMGLNCIRFDINTNSELIPLFSSAISTINTHLCDRFVEAQTQDLKPMARPTSPPGKVLIVCETGNERSAAVVAAYLMAMYCLDHIQAMQVLNSQRFCVALNDEMRTRLQTYNDILKAKRDLFLDLDDLSLDDNTTKKETAAIIDPTQFQARPSWLYEPPKATTVTKRQLDQVYGDEEEVMTAFGESDRARFQKRDIFAPFADAEEDGWVEF